MLIHEKSTNDLSIKQLLENLTGEASTFDQNYIDPDKYFDEQQTGVGYSQFNELLLIFGYDRISHGFFQFLVDAANDENLSVLRSRKDLQNGVEIFRKIALFAFGNIRYAFKRLSTEKEFGLLQNLLDVALKPIDESRFRLRADQIQPIEEISGDETYYLGYIIQDQINKKFKENPNDQQNNRENDKCKLIVEKGKQNFNGYLASDFIDVYVATSMRERHEYYFTNKWVKSIFGNSKLSTMKLRWFDPTQAYCSHRIDKGIFEGLMLKRAKCTIYFVQESDTLGKDSEFATTLAQGKTVIAFVPSITNQYVDEFLNILVKLESYEDVRVCILKQLRVFEPSAAWDDPQIRKWIEDINTMNIVVAKERLQMKMEEHYNKRANVLKNTHPLGMQVNLKTGVANGVLVVRNIDDCAELVYRTMTLTMEFSLREEIIGNKKYLYLIEAISKCTYRVVSGDEKLTNSFWNYYLTE